jgi:hypothetical protein
MKKMPIELEQEKKAREEARQIAESVLAVLASRGIAISDDQRARVLENEKADQLKEWLVSAATAASTEAVIGDPDE